KGNLCSLTRSLSPPYARCEWFWIDWPVKKPGRSPRISHRPGGATPHGSPCAVSMRGPPSHGKPETRAIKRRPSPQRGLRIHGKGHARCNVTGRARPAGATIGMAVLLLRESIFTLGSLGCRQTPSSQRLTIEVGAMTLSGVWRTGTDMERINCQLHWSDYSRIP